MSDLSKDYINGLLEDSKRVASYAARSGVVKDSPLFAAIGKVELIAPDQRKPSDPDVVELQKVLNETIRVIRPETLIALKRGWDPYAVTKAESRIVWPVIIVTVLFVLMTAHLSTVYNSGLSLIKDIEINSLVDPERRLSELSRQLVEARQAIDSPAGDGEDAESKNLKWQAYFSLYDDLEQLNRKVNDINGRVFEYSTRAAYPLWGMEYFSRHIRNFSSGGVINSSSMPAPNHSFFGAVGEGIKKKFFDFAMYLGLFRYNYMESAGQVCAVSPSGDKIIEQVDFAENAMSSKLFSLNLKNYLQGSYYLKCYELTSKFGAPDMEYLKRVVNGLIVPYALWVLPGLYGMLGALIFHVRRFLDPVSVNYHPANILLRVSMGALAGMILAWFWVPETLLGTELANSGFTLFGLCFIIGFSIDIFFAMLDRLVFVAETSIGKIGTPT